ncbi:alkaline phosphatase [Geminocystis sp. NIES-3708]|uniref:tandem-95 repeat protein n=1 Tax=Geminocystis sp. NIES-3708 TaxID=1615909 RepID=UPI0005FCBDF9|nr:tandem-95 repeat protein [Geminocystis sp. NIES-3708]BAQ62886.1 alkaline phosphatase [Geminocystis sp. NIES-3708]
MTDSTVRYLSQMLKPILANFADSDDFTVQMAEIFGISAEVDILRQQWKNESWVLPTVELVSSSVINGALGAYSLQTGKIYLSQELINSNNTDLIIGILLEEYGHHVDGLLNVTDTLGDEGELFSNLLRGIILSEAQLHNISTENDHATIVINGEETPIEMDASTFIVNSTDDTDDGDINNGVTTLREAVNAANASSGADTITFGGSVFTDDTPDKIILTNGQLFINDSLTIIGTGINQLTLSGDANNSGNNDGGDVRLFFVNQGTVNLSNLTLSGGRSQGGNGQESGGGGGAGMGGALFINDGIVKLGNITFTNNQAIGGNGGLKGGALYGGRGGGFGGYEGLDNVGIDGLGGASTGTLTPGENNAGFGGGGGSSFFRGGNGGFGGGGGGGSTPASIGFGGFGGGNPAPNASGGGGAGFGGAIFIRSGSLDLQDTSFTNNSTVGGIGDSGGQGLGGAIFVVPAELTGQTGRPAPTVTGTNVSFVNNSASNDAGVVANNDNLFGPTTFPAPTLVGMIADQLIIENSPFNFILPTGLFNDVDGEGSLTYVATLADGSPLPGSLTLNGSSFSGTPSLNFNGTLQIKITAFNTSKASVSTIFDLIVVNPIANQSIQEDSSFNFTVPDNAFEDFVDSAGGSVTYTATLANGSPLPGSLSFDGRSFSGTPPLNFSGAISIKVTATNNNASISDVFVLTVTSVNDVPVALADIALSSYNLPIEGSVATNDSDVDVNSILTYSLLAPVDGLTLNPDGSYLFNPNVFITSGNSSDTLLANYRVTDEFGAFSDSTLTINLSGNAPIGSPTATLEDIKKNTSLVPTSLVFSAADLLDGFSDPDGDSISLVNLTASNGTLVNNNDGTYTFTPTADFTGVVNLSYGVSDGTYTLRGQTRTFNVLPYDFSIPKNTAVTVNNSTLLAGVVNVDNDPLSVSNLTASIGTLINKSDGSYTFIPPVDFAGLITLTYDVSDGQNPPSQQTRTVEVTNQLFPVFDGGDPSYSNKAGVSDLIKVYWGYDTNGNIIGSARSFAELRFWTPNILVNDIQSINFTKVLAATPSMIGVAGISASNNSGIGSGQSGIRDILGLLERFGSILDPNFPYGQSSATVTNYLTSLYMNVDGSHAGFVNLSNPDLKFALEQDKPITESYAYWVLHIDNTVNHPRSRYGYYGYYNYVTLSLEQNAPPVATPKSLSFTEDAGFFYPELQSTIDFALGLLLPGVEDEIVSSNPSSWFAQNALVRVDGIPGLQTLRQSILYYEGDPSDVVLADTGNAAYQHLAQGATKTIVGSYTVQDDFYKTGTAPLTVTFTGVNDAPVAVADTNSGLTNTIIEGSVATNDSDVDDGAILTYSLIAPLDGLTLNADGSYSLDATHFSFSFGQTVGAIANYRVTDEFGAFSDSTLTLTLVQNSPPTGEPTDISLSNNTVIENVVPGTAIGLFTAIDPDVNDSFSYSLVSGEGDTDNANFEIVGNQLRINASPDFETKSSYSIRVKTTDQGNLSTEKTFTVTINNLDEVAPTITSGSTVKAINENSGASQIVYSVASIDTGDIATGATTYSLKNEGDFAAFTINSISGQVSLIANPDFETKSSYSFTVIATDAANNASEKAVTLGINNLDEVAPTITSGVTATTINENSGANQIIYIIVATDLVDFTDGVVTYSLKNERDFAALIINSTSGQVSLIANPDFETKSSYSFTVIATDGANNASEKAVTLGINNLDEVTPDLNQAPVLTVPTAKTVNQNTPLILGGISIADPDAGSGNQTVTLSATSGTITLASTAGLTILAGGSGSSNLTFSGTLNNVNAALKNLIYQSNSTFSGSDTINLTVNDNGNTGSGGAKQDSDSIAVTVKAVTQTAPSLSTDILAVNSVRTTIIADFNNDNLSDIGYTNSLNAFYVAINNGAGGYLSRVTFPTNKKPGGGAVTNLNGHAGLDLILPNKTTNNVSVFLSNGTASPTITTVTTGTNPVFVVTGDFNEDSNKDMAVANYGNNTVSVFLGNGVGGFSSPTSLTAGSKPSAMAVGDFNGDGKSDLAVTNYSANTVSIFQGAGDGTFGTKTDYLTGTSPNSVAVGDFDKDGDFDLVVNNNKSNTLSVFLNNGSGGFSPKTDIALSANLSAYSVTVGDFNSDSNLDLRVANNLTNNAGILTGDGLGNFSAISNLTIIQIPSV